MQLCSLLAKHNRSTQREMKVAVLLPCFLLLLSHVRGYPAGPPVGACVSMFPTGHGVDAQTSAPPYELMVNSTQLTPGGAISVTLRATGNPDYPYFEGMFVQARMANCGSDKPIGTFSIPDGDTFMQIMDCHSERPMSAVAHKIAQHETNKTFTWIAPMSEPGRIYFRATVVKNEKTFWTNVFSEYVEDATDQSEVPTMHCGVQSKQSSSASSLGALASLVVAAVVISLRFD